VRKIVVYELLSLDGVAEAPDTFFGWDDALDGRLAAVIATQDAVILGRHSYDAWVGFWPGSDLPSIQLESIRSEVSPTGYLLVDYRVLR
jgi:dihydrofolate reductase